MTLQDFLHKVLRHQAALSLAISIKDAHKIVSNLGSEALWDANLSDPEYDSVDQKIEEAKRLLIEAYNEVLTVETERQSSIRSTVVMNPGDELIESQ